MNFLMEGNRQSSLNPDQGRGRSTHQNAAHKLMRDAGYSFTRKDGNMHNHYRNSFDQEIVVVGSPKNSSEGINRLRTTIRRHQRQREEGIPVPTTVTLVDQFVGMADEFLMKPLPPEAGPKSPQANAKYAAYCKWLRRVIEKHGPQPIDPLVEATVRLHAPENWARQRARKDLGMVVYREGGGEGSTWMTCFPYQVPEGRKVRELIKTPVGVAVEEPEEPPVPPYIQQHRDEIAAEKNGNGKRELTDQQAAFLMMAETVGIKLPGEEARIALDRAHDALIDALARVDEARAALA